jgi:hypothetical protein
MQFTSMFRLSTCPPTGIRWVLVVLTLAWLTGCALSKPMKSSVRDPFVQGDKFSCGEQTPKGRTH